MTNRHVQMKFSSTCQSNRTVPMICTDAFARCRLSARTTRGPNDRLEHRVRAMASVSEVSLMLSEYLAQYANRMLILFG